MAPLLRILILLFIPEATSASSYIFLRNKNLTEIPFSEIPTHKSGIFLTSNFIEVVPAMAFANYSNLQILNLKKNKLYFIHDTAFQGTQLKVLIVQINNLTTATFLPPIQNSLVHLDISYNYFLHLSDTFEFSHFRVLEKLYISHTAISHVPDLGTLVPSLQGLKMNQMHALACDCRLAWLKGNHGIYSIFGNNRCTYSNECSLRRWRLAQQYQVICHDFTGMETIPDSDILFDCNKETCIDLTLVATGNLTLSIKLGGPTKSLQLSATFNCSNGAVDCAKSGGLYAYMAKETPRGLCGDHSMCRVEDLAGERDGTYISWKFKCVCFSGMCSEVYLQISANTNHTICEIKIL